MGAVMGAGTRAGGGGVDISAAGGEGRVQGGGPSSDAEGLPGLGNSWWNGIGSVRVRGPAEGR
jgi:hypothetical protein